MVVIPNELELLEKRLLELDAQLDNIDVAQNCSPVLERAHLRIRLCQEYVDLSRRLQDLKAVIPDIAAIKREQRNADFNIRGRQQLDWGEALQLALAESSGPLTIEDIARAITHGAWMRETAAINESTIRSAIDRYRDRLGIIKIKGSDRRNRYWLAARPLSTSR